MNSPMLDFPRPSEFEPICGESGLTTTIVPAILLLAMVALGMVPAFANIYGAIRGIVHDPQHRPVQGAMVMLKAKSSDWAKSVNTDDNGQFSFNVVPIGEYSVSVASPGFAQALQNAVVNSSSEPVVHFQLKLAGAKESISVSAAPIVAPTDSVTPRTLVDRADIQRTPSASHSNSLAMITDYVPGSYVTHDQLHIRGGHQTSWLVDGIPVPNTNIASNLGPQIDPKDIDYVEVNRGSYGAEFGDRTYGVFNIVPRTGFERNNEAEMFLSAGNFYQTNAQLSFGSHTERFAYYASVNGNRSNLGLQTPVSEVVHDATNGYGGFGSLIFNVDPSNQLRFVTSLRKDYYQIPYDPFPNDIENAPIAQNGFAAQYPSIGLRDGQHEGDAFLNFSWVHTFNSKTLLTVSPFYHYNKANYDGMADDVPIASTDHRTSNYAGGQASLNVNIARNNFQTGLYSFYQQDHELFGAIFNDGSGNSPVTDRERPSGSLTAYFVDDKFKPLSWLTLSAGMRPTQFSGGVSENAISPRFGFALNVPHLNWTFRAFYGHYYQAPPLITVSGPLVQFCNANNCGFLAVRGERDEEHQFGVTIPYLGWVLDLANFKTNAHNFFDHSCIGSGACFPITIAQAVIRGWELMLRSPRIAHRGQIHLAYSNQIAEGALPITGGLTNFSPPTPLFPLDHDQRNTLNLGGDVSLPWRSYASTNVYYGSGFSNAFPGQPYPGDHLPQHTTFDLSIGKDFAERFSASLNAVNVANRRLELDNSQTFGGFHWNNPREIYVELRYRFHY
jgi:TonB dependent receptor/Carboxypeptidase regulatory-like domain/TonB-dependent Receptor Plug Domain